MLELAAEGDFATRVATFYRRRGYTVHENVKVRGMSEKVYPLRLVAQGPLGSLAVSFGDAGGVDEHEVARVRTLAKDIGATPVVAAVSPGQSLRRLAAQLAVVILDEEALAEPAPSTSAQELRSALSSHPWPTSGRTESAPAPWPSGPSRAVEVDDWMDSITKRPAAVPTPTPPTEEAILPDLAPALPAESLSATPQASFDWLHAETLQAPARPPEPLALEHDSTLVTDPGQSVLEVEIPASVVARAEAAEAAYLRLIWVKRIAWSGLGLLGLFLFARYIVGL
ncbi:MAG: hypothetical protein AABX89_06615 [Candidatus Thermoplasmatota archaeon]